MALALPAASLAMGCKKDDADPNGTASPKDTGLTTEPRPEPPTAWWSGVAPVDPVRFPLGAQTGEPLPDSFVAWTYAPDEAEVDIQLARWDGSAWVEEEALPTTPSAEGYVHLEPTGLASDTYYAIQAVTPDGAGSAVAHIHTAPDPEAAVEVRFGGTSCLDQTHGEFPSLDALQTLGPIDGMLWLGDTVYADGRRTVEAYRDLWQEQLAKGTIQRLFAVAPGVFTWDDHEVDNNWDPQTFPAPQLNAAVNAFFETVPLPESVRSTRRLWRSLRFGRTVELFMLDVRSERDRAAGHYISPEQLDWLRSGLSDSPCVWKLVATSVPITDWPLAFDVLNAQLDRWDGFGGTQRQDLIDHIVDNDLRGVMFVSGDLHQTTLSYLDPAGGKGENLLEFLVGPGGSFINIAARLLEGEQFPYGDADWSAGRMVFRPDGTARLQTIHEDGEMMMEAVIDLDGNVTLELENHPWDQD
jgi:alkaline phosphatase D